VYYNLGSALRSKGRLNEAVECYNRALQINPDYAEAHNNLGSILRVQGRLDEAISHFCQAIEINSNFAEAYNNLANTLQAQGKLDEAISGYRQALQIEPNMAQIHYNLGIALSQQGKSGEAIECYRRAIELKPNWLLPVNSLAKILVAQPDMNKNNTAETIKLAERAAELSKYQNISILETLATAYASGGQFEKAASAVEKALGLASAVNDDEKANHLRKELELYRQSKH
jgi:tetratricopeptide (TPR) repeat protein